jgi:ribonuclease III
MSGLLATLERLSAALGHTFGDPRLLETALTHRSFVHEHPNLATDDNERLEFLGDSVFGLAAAMLLRDRFPEAREGELTRRRADLVNERALSGIASELDLGQALRLGRGEERTGGRSKPRLLASSLEACVAAVLLDAGVERAMGVARSLLVTRVDAVAPGEHDFKSRLQEALQARGDVAPRYELERTEGPEHARVFFVALVSREEILARGQGRSKAEAEQRAAEAALIDMVSG